MNPEMTHRSLWKKVLLTVLIGGIFSIPTFIDSASAGVYPEPYLVWTGVTLNSQGGFTQSITPLAIDRDLRWQTYFGTTCNSSVADTANTNGSCLEIQLFGDGRVSFNDIRGNNTEVKAFSNSTCQTYSGNPWKDVNGRQGECVLPLTVNAGTKYTISVKPFASLSGNWWLASIQQGTSGDLIPIGAIRHDQLPEISLFENEIRTFSANQPISYVTCADVPFGSAIFSKPLNDFSPTYVQFRTHSDDGCHFSIDSLFDAADSIKLQYGVEQKTVATPTPTKSSTPKPTTTVSSKLRKPTDLSAKKVSYKFVGSYLYFNIPLPTAATKAFLISPILGYPDSSPLHATIKNHVATFTARINSDSSGESTILLIYSSNAAGSSSELSYPIQFPKVAVSKPSPTSKPTPTATPTKSEAATPPTVNCNKGDQKRVFEASDCPPGWTKG